MTIIMGTTRSITHHVCWGTNMANRAIAGIKKKPNVTTSVTKFAIPLTMTTKIKELLQALPEALLLGAPLV